MEVNYAYDLVLCDRSPLDTERKKIKRELYRCGETDLNDMKSSQHNNKKHGDTVKEESIQLGNVDEDQCNREGLHIGSMFAAEGSTETDHVQSRKQIYKNSTLLRWQCRYMETKNGTLLCIYLFIVSYLPRSAPGVPTTIPSVRSRIKARIQIKWGGDLEG